MQQRTCPPAKTPKVKVVWTNQQQLKLHQLFIEYGSKWSYISKKMDKVHKDTDLKNKLYSTLRKGLRKMNAYIKNIKRKDPRKCFLNYKIIDKIIINKIIAVIDENYKDKFEVKDSSISQAKRILSQVILLATDERQFNDIEPQEKYQKMEKFLRQLKDFSKNCKKKRTAIIPNMNKYKNKFLPISNIERERQRFIQDQQSQNENIREDDQQHSFESQVEQEKQQFDKNVQKITQKTQKQVQNKNPEQILAPPMMPPQQFYARIQEHYFHQHQQHNYLFEKTLFDSQNMRMMIQNAERRSDYLSNSRDANKSSRNIFSDSSQYMNPLIPFDFSNPYFFQSNQLLSSSGPSSNQTGFKFLDANNEQFIFQSNLTQMNMPISSSSGSFDGTSMNSSLQKKKSFIEEVREEPSQKMNFCNNYVYPQPSNGHFLLENSAKIDQSSLYQFEPKLKPTTIPNEVKIDKFPKIQQNKQLSFSMPKIYNLQKQEKNFFESQNLEEKEINNQIKQNQNSKEYHLFGDNNDMK